MVKNDKKKPHFVSEVRILRQYERSNQVTCHVLYPLGIDKTNVYINFINPMIFNDCDKRKVQIADNLTLNVQ